MKTGDLEKQYIFELTHLYDQEEAKSLFGLAVESVLDISPVKLKMMKDSFLDNDQIQKILQVLSELRQGKPIQHIIGEAHFYGLVFKVNQNVLIPRPETEELVDWITNDYQGLSLSDLNILDIGTGSGCIPISLKKNIEHAKVSTLDISPEAITLAKENAKLNEVNIEFMNVSIFDFSSELKFDVIVSNPPYIRDLEKMEMHQNVLEHEPHLALFVSDERPLIFYEAIADLAICNLKANGALYFEINEYLGEEMLAMLDLKGFTKLELRADMQGKPRMLKASI